MSIKFIIVKDIIIAYYLKFFHQPLISFTFKILDRDADLKVINQVDYLRQNENFIIKNIDFKLVIINLKI